MQTKMQTHSRLCHLQSVDTQVTSGQTIEDMLTLPEGQARHQRPSGPLTPITQ
jgi:hypothetical protein